MSLVNSSGNSEDGKTLRRELWKHRLTSWDSVTSPSTRIARPGPGKGCRHYRRYQRQPPHLMTLNTDCSQDA